MMTTEKAFYDQFLQGIVLAFFAITIVFFIFSKDLFLTGITIASITYIWICVITIIVWFGFELGVSENIALLIGFGLSVDFVTYLSADYINSREDTRFLRM